MARKKTDKKDDKISVTSLSDIRDVLVDTLNQLERKTITASEAKTRVYCLQTLLATVKQLNETDDNQDSIRELVALIQKQRDAQGGNK